MFRVKDLIFTLISFLKRSSTMPVKLKDVIPQDGNIEVTLEGHADVAAQNH